MGCANTADIKNSEGKTLDPLDRTEIESESPLTVLNPDVNLFFQDLESDCPCGGGRPKPNWAAQPFSVASRSVAHLNRLISRKNYVFDEDDLCSNAELIVKSLSKDDESLQQHLVYFIYKSRLNRHEFFMHCLLYTSPSPRDS